MRKSIIGTGVLLLIISLMMIISPELCVKVSVIALGVGGIINGIYNLFTVRSYVADKTFKQVVAIRGLLSIAVGLVAIILPIFLAATIWNILIYVLAIFLLLSAGMEIVSTLRLKKEGIPIKVFTIEIISSIILALILFIIPATVGLALIRIIGIILLLASISLVILEWRSQSKETATYVVVDDENDKGGDNKNADDESE